VTTTKGEITIELYPADAPESVNNFVVLAQLGYWDNFPINFVDPGAFVLTGSPGGIPTSDIGYTVPPEVKRPSGLGAVGYWYREDKLASSGSQFYIMLIEPENPEGAGTVFGAVVEGMEAAAALTMEDRVLTVTIEEP
jgi:peptidyl-prolyl cis-trans isomerase B (cyclophilin B)